MEFPAFFLLPYGISSLVFFLPYGISRNFSPTLWNFQADSPLPYGISSLVFSLPYGISNILLPTLSNFQLNFFSILWKFRCILAWQPLRNFYFNIFHTLWKFNYLLLGTSMEISSALWNIHLGYSQTLWKFCCFWTWYLYAMEFPPSFFFLVFWNGIFF